MTIKNLILISLLLIGGGNAQAEESQEFSKNPEALYNKILQMDKTLFTAFNDCDYNTFVRIMDQDLEFYDDRSGLSKGRVNEEKSFKDRCKSGETNFIRTLVEDKIQIYPLDHFGAVQIGEHQFHERRKDGKFVLVGRGNFIHIWKEKNGNWTVTRVISYEHGPDGISLENK